MNTDFEESTAKILDRLERFGLVLVQREYFKSFGDAVATFETSSMKLQRYRHKSELALDVGPKVTNETRNSRCLGVS